MINRRNKKLVDTYLEYRKKYDRIDYKSIRLERTVSIHYLSWCDETDFNKAPNLVPSFIDYVEQMDCSDHYKQKLISSAKRFFEWLSINHMGFRSITPAWLQTFKYKASKEEFQYDFTVSEDEISIITKLPAKTLVEKRIQAGVCLLYVSGMRVIAIQKSSFHQIGSEKGEGVW